MHPSMSHHLNRLVDRLADLRVRLRDAARHEVAEAISESLAEATRRLLGAPARPRPRAYSGEPYWEDPSEDELYDEEVSWSQPHHEPHAARPVQNAAPSRVATALMTAVGVARWSYCRTGQPLPALVVAVLAASAVLLFGDDALLLPKVCSALQELLPRCEAED